MRVVAHGAGEHPPGVHIGQVQGPGELALEGRAAVRDGVALEEPRLGLDLIAGLADLDRGPQQRRGFRGRHPVIWSVAFAGARYRSIDAALIASSSARTAGLYRSRPKTSSPWRSSPSSWMRIEAARYFPHCPPEAAHTRCSTFNAS